MNRFWKTLSVISFFALAMALVEAAVVIYLRAMLQPAGAALPLQPYLRIEIAREAATLVMLAAAGWLAGPAPAARAAWFVYAFGLWDLGYYLWLKILAHWPMSLFDPDVLFLIPIPWTAPVIAPVMVAALLCLAALLALARLEHGQTVGFGFAHFALFASGVLGALCTFLVDALRLLSAGHSNWADLRPGLFAWPFFLASFVLMALPILLAAGRIPLHRRKPQ